MKNAPEILLGILLFGGILLSTTPPSMWRGQEFPLPALRLQSTFTELSRFTGAEPSPCEREPTLRLRPGEGLQKAVDEAPSGAVIQLAAGTYTVPDHGLRISKSLVLCGEDRLLTTTILQASEPLSADNMVHVFCAERGPTPCEGPIHVWLEGLTLDRTPQPFRGQATNLAVEGQVRLTFKRGWVVESLFHGIRVLRGAELFLEDVSVANNNDVGILLRDGKAHLQRVRILRSWGRFGPSGGIAVNGESTAVIQDSWIIENGTGILTRSLAENAESRGAQVQIERSWIVGNLAGLYILEGSNVSVRETSIQNNQEGILLEEGQLTLEDSEVAYNYNRGVFLGPAVLATLDNNLIHDNDFGIAINVQACNWAGVPLGSQEFTGRLEGSGNRIFDNRVMDLCPEEFPWPEGFATNGS